MRTPELPSRSTTRIRSRWVRALVLLGLIAVAGCALLAAHRPLMRGAGWMLVRSDATERADVIVVAADADGAGVLEAADLVHEGFATRVALFVNQLDRASQEFQSRGVLYTDEAARSVSALRA